MISKLQQLASIFLILANLFAHGAAQGTRCYENGNYTSNSTYETNLNNLLSSLPTNVDYNGFYNASIGQSPDTAYAYVLCRGDVRPETCSTCIQTAIDVIVRSCKYYKQAVRFEEFCTLRYSNESMFGNMEGVPMLLGRNPLNASSPDQFMADTGRLVGDLRGQAAAGGSLRKVAAGNRSSVDNQTVFSLVQCTPDLSPESCSACLMVAADVRSTCRGSIGCRVIRPSCTMRYEVSTFYNETRLQEVQTLITNAPPPPPPEPPGKKTRNIIIIVVVSTFVCLIAAIVSGILFAKRRKRQHMERLESTPDMTASDSLQYGFHEIKDATDDFSDANILGQGGFGAVYKGRLSDGQEIAVKRLSVDSGQGDLEFKNEVLLVAKLRHRNLVRLLGFSMKGKERILIYEFVKNTSLDRFIFDPVKRNYLDWETRYKIIGGISRGLLYLHEESRFKIIHRDLKASNILLDGEMNPKIADFGMARLCATDETQGNTNRIVGTYGYMSPEYAMHGQFSVKSDVFSFGVLILEIITGKRNSSFRHGDNIEDLLSLTWKYWRQGTIEDIIDPTLMAGLGSLQDIVRCIHIGLLCVQDNLTDRPTIASVVLMLSSSTISLSVPLEPVFFATSGHGSKINIFPTVDSKDFDSTKSSSQVESSRNVMSMTDFYPR